MNNQNKIINQDQIRQHKIKKVDNFIFDFIDIIGSGYSSQVYRGQDCINGANVAIKVIQLKKINNQVEKILLNNQAKALSIMNHPNILRSFHTMQTPNNFYIVTQLFQQNVQNYLKIKGKFSQPQVMKFLCKIVNSLSYLQMLGILHRDVKPSNVFIRNDQQYVLGDFGFCYFMNMPYMEKGYNIGSPLYMSPQATKNSIYSCKSDVWSLGICLLELLIGDKPFVQMSYDQIIHSICQLKFYRNLNISDRLKELLDLMLQFNLEKRITPLDLFKKLSFMGPEIQMMLYQPTPIINNNAESAQKHSRTASIRFSQMDKQISFRNSQKRKVSPQYCIGQQNSYQIKNFKKNTNIQRSQQPLKQINIQNITQNRAKSNYDISSVPNQRTLLLQNLTRILQKDFNIIRSQNKLKLFRLLCLTTNFEFPQILYPYIQQLPLDCYFNYILDTINPGQIQPIIHYLAYLLQNTIRQYENQEIGVRLQDQSYGMKLNCLKSTFYLLKIPTSVNHPKPDEKIIRNVPSAQKALDRNKSKSVGNFLLGSFLQPKQNFI